MGPLIAGKWKMHGLIAPLVEIEQAESASPGKPATAMPA
jgi:hypothetical protein